MPKGKSTGRPGHPSWQIIVAIGAEGGALTLLGHRRNACWVFRHAVVDQTPTLIDERAIRHSSETVATWPEALDLLDRYRWGLLSPIKVRPTFADKVMKAVSQRLPGRPSYDRQIVKWGAVCEEALGVLPRHRLAPLIDSAIHDRNFETRWSDASDEAFRPFAAAVFELSDAEHLDGGARSALVRDIGSRKRTEMLAELLGKPVAPRAIKWLARTQWRHMTRGDWETLFSIAATGKAGVALGHVRRITPILLRQFQLIPEAVRVPGLLNVASKLDVPAERWGRLGEFLAKADAGWRADLIHKARTIDTYGDFWDFYDRCEGRYWHPFDIPESFTRSELLEPIASPLDMEAEALRMNNCLAIRVSRVQSGSRVYFRLRDHGMVNAELVRQGPGWAPGDILGPRNSAVPAEVAGRVRSELRRLADAAGSKDGTNDFLAEDAYVDALCAFARQSFAPAEVAKVRDALQLIRGRSKSWSDGAYAIFTLKNGTYIQFMSSPDGAEYLLEVASHRYLPRVTEFLTTAAVELIERAGFVWPNKKGNFLRWFNVSSAEDVQTMAELALAIQARVFRRASGENLSIRTHIPD